MFVFERKYEPTVKATTLKELENATQNATKSATMNATIDATSNEEKESHKADSESSLIFNEIENKEKENASPSAIRNSAMTDKSSKAKKTNNRLKIDLSVLNEIRDNT